MSLQRLTDPSFALVSHERVRLHSRIDDAVDTDWITDAIAAATHFIEEYLGCAIATATYRLNLDAFPRNPASIPVPIWPVAAITTLAYTDAAGANATVDISTIVQPTSNRERYRIQRVDYADWPEARETPNAVRITFTAGWATQAEIPQSIVRAALMLIGHWYENRETIFVDLKGTGSKELEFGTTQLLELARPDEDLMPWDD